MNKNILEEFFYDGFIRGEQTMPKRPDYTQAITATSNIEKELEERLSASDFALFEQFKQEHAKIESIMEANRFIYGWKLGSKFTLATFME